MPLDELGELLEAAYRQGFINVNKKLINEEAENGECQNS